MNDSSIKDRAWWEEYFAPGSGWERNGGRSQSRIFAEHFTAHLDLDPNAVFSILDMGCALGDALKHFAKTYPHAELNGIDFSATAIARCKQEFGTRATFSVGAIEDVNRIYSIIYCSNTLEHFADFETIARHLVKYCKRLCILVPYNELDAHNNPLVPDSSEHHQRTFLRNSFDFLLCEGLVHNIKTHVFSCPGAWGWDPYTRVKQAVKNVGRTLLKKRKRMEPQQILFDIVVAT
jgi:cyclopropane fatty-acyl-phospholipid synthase-like methyltransferase